MNEEEPYIGMVVKKNGRSHVVTAEDVIRFHEMVAAKLNYLSKLLREKDIPSPIVDAIDALSDGEIELEDLSSRMDDGILDSYNSGGMSRTQAESLLRK